MAALLTLAAALLIAACGGTAVSPTPSAGPSASPSAPAPSGSPQAPSPVPSQPSQPSASPVPATPSPAPSAPAVVLETDSIARVITNDLRVRSKPEISDSSELLTPLLQNGRRLFVVDGPVEADGYAWYLVAPITEHIEDQAPFGWVAAADNDTGEPWLAADSEACPALPTTFAERAAVPALIALACFANQEIEFDAKVLRPEATCGVDPGWGITPAWLGAICVGPEFIAFDPAGQASDFETITEPGFEAPGVDPGVVEAQDVVIRGAYDHPESSACRLEIFEPEATPNLTPEQVVLHCRSQFVVSAIEPA